MNERGGVEREEGERAEAAGPSLLGGYVQNAGSLGLLLYLFWLWVVPTPIVGL